MIKRFVSELPQVPEVVLGVGVLLGVFTLLGVEYSRVGSLTDPFHERIGNVYVGCFLPRHYIFLLHSLLMNLAQGLPVRKAPEQLSVFLLNENFLCAATLVLHNVQALSRRLQLHAVHRVVGVNCVVNGVDVVNGCRIVFLIANDDEAKL